MRSRSQTPPVDAKNQIRETRDGLGWKGPFPALRIPVEKISSFFFFFFQAGGAERPRGGRGTHGAAPEKNHPQRDAEEIPRYGGSGERGDTSSGNRPSEAKIPNISTRGSFRKQSHGTNKNPHTPHFYPKFPSPPFPLSQPHQERGKTGQSQPQNSPHPFPKSFPFPAQRT